MDPKLNDSLNPRKKLILKAIIWEYVAEVEPVASETLVSKYELGVRSATVRNEMAEMSEMGYLDQPHTSAGRIPSNVGYRYYVNHMVNLAPPQTEDQTKVLSATQKADFLREILGETTRVLSRMTHQMTAAGLLTHSHVRVKRALASALGPGKVLIVVVFENGDIENKLVEGPPETTLEDIGLLNDWLERETAGLSIKQLSRLKLSDNPTAVRPAFSRLQKNVIQSLKQVALDHTKENTMIEGEEYILSQPEFRTNSPLLEQMIIELESGQAATDLLEGHMKDTLEVNIGKDQGTGLANYLSVLRHKFQIGGEDAGYLAIIGPTRQNYDRNLSILQFAAKAMSQTLDETLR